MVRTGPVWRFPDSMEVGKQGPVCVHVCAYVYVCVTHTQELITISLLVFFTRCFPNKQPTKFQCFLTNSSNTVPGGRGRRAGLQNPPGSSPPACWAGGQLGSQSPVCRQGWYVHHEL